MNLVLDKKDFDKFFYTLEVVKKVEKVPKCKVSMLDSNGVHYTVAFDGRCLVYIDGELNDALSREVHALANEGSLFQIVHDKYLIVEARDPDEIWYLSLKDKEMGIFEGTKVKIHIGEGKVTSLNQVSSDKLL